MELYYAFSFLIVLAAIFSFINNRFLRIAPSIGIMIIAFMISLVMLVIKRFIPEFFANFSGFMSSFDFTDILMGAMLNFLLFAGAVHINLNDLREQRAPVMIFSTVSVIISAFVISATLYYIAPLMGFDIPYLYCLLFGALISPTDPIAVLSILKESKVPKSLETKIAGESLFNDGVAVVFFAVVLQLAKGTNVDLNFLNVSWLFIKEAGGGVILGLLLGYIATKAMKKTDDYKVCVMITLAVVMGGYLIAHNFHISGPLTMVIAGLYIGQVGKNGSVSPVTKDYLDKFWELNDEILNAILFMFIGFELLLIDDLLDFWTIGLVSIGIVLFGRLLSIWIPAKTVPFKAKFGPQTIKLLVWGGLRGGVSIALALSINEGPYKNFIIAITYFVVVFSIVIQGLSIKRVAGKLNSEAMEEPNVA